MKAEEYAALFVPGKSCTINTSGDIYMDYDARPFIGSDCHIVKRTKGGRILVALAERPSMQYSFAQKNVNLK